MGAGWSSKQQLRALCGSWASWWCRVADGCEYWQCWEEEPCYWTPFLASHYCEWRRRWHQGYPYGLSYIDPKCSITFCMLSFTAMVKHFLFINNCMLLFIAFVPK